MARDERRTGQLCSRCGVAVAKRDGLCWACYQYRRRHGIDRPWPVIRDSVDMQLGSRRRRRPEPTGWEAQAGRAIEELLETDRTFTEVDVILLAGEPPSPDDIGDVMRRYRAADLIFALGGTYLSEYPNPPKALKGKNYLSLYCAPRHSARLMAEYEAERGLSPITDPDER